jgi:hypothetical protein
MKDKIRKRSARGLNGKGAQVAEGGRDKRNKYKTLEVGEEEHEVEGERVVKEGVFRV